MSISNRSTSNKLNSEKVTAQTDLHLSIPGGCFCLFCLVFVHQLSQPPRIDSLLFLGVC